MHHVYRTDGLILKSVNVGEASRSITVFTRELGLVRVRAQGVRLLKSKLRFHVQNFSLVRVALVRGREVWRLTNAMHVLDVYHAFIHAGKLNYLYVIANTFRLLERLLQGEEKNEYLFETMCDFVRFLHAEKLNEDEVRSAEFIAVARMLYALGYLSRDSLNLSLFVSTLSWHKNLLSQMAEVQNSILQEINNALKESQL
jgi:DNA repair protein RecO